MIIVFFVPMHCMHCVRYNAAEHASVTNIIYEFIALTSNLLTRGSLNPRSAVTCTIQKYIDILIYQSWYIFFDNNTYI